MDPETRDSDHAQSTEENAAEQGAPRRHWLVRLVNAVPVLMIRFYQTCVSPLFPPTCRFTPSCSTYALHAFRTRNIFMAMWLTVWRIMRCNPFNPGGFDPVPDPKPKE